MDRLVFLQVTFKKKILRNLVAEKQVNNLHCLQVGGESPTPGATAEAGGCNSRNVIFSWNPLLLDQRFVFLRSPQACMLYNVSMRVQLHVCELCIARTAGCTSSYNS